MRILKDIPKKTQTTEICCKYIKNDINNIRYASAKVLTYDLCLYVVRKDGNLLRHVPEKFRDYAMCVEAVLNNIKAFECIPNELKKEILSNNRELCNRIALFKAEWFQYIPIDFCSVSLCLSALKRDNEVALYLPDEYKTNLEILEYEKQEGIITVVDKTYREGDGIFVITVSIKDSKRVEVSFGTFNDFYSFLDADLKGAVLYGYDFNGIDIKKYNIKGAYISGAVLSKLGKCNNSFYEKNVLSNKELFRNCLEEEISTELLVGEEKQELVDFYYFERRADRAHRQATFFYISDIHLCHQLYRKCGECATEEEVRWYIRLLVKKLVSNPKVNYFDWLLISGDTASSYEIAEIFYEELAKNWYTSHVVVVLGNHELMDDSIETLDDIQKYRVLFEKLGICFLQNEVLFVSEEKTQKLNENSILSISEQELNDIARKSYITILGGIGFSGYNAVYNGDSLDYGRTITSLVKDMFETKRFEALYQKVRQALQKRQIIVLTHTPKKDWTMEEHNPNWIYVSGHTHQNESEVSKEKIVYADNQIGYKGNNNIHLKSFNCSTTYDIFSDYKDGIYEISREDYYWFNRGKGIQAQFNRKEGTIYMVKKEEIYAFFLYVNEKIYMLNGGVPNKLEINKLEHLEFYYLNLPKYAENIRKLIGKYSSGQKEIAEFVKSIGGLGRIHGCIVDIDEYNHIYVNPYDGSITPYFAFDIIEKYPYADVPSLLEKELPWLYDNYVKKLESEGEKAFPAVCYPVSDEKSGTKIYESTDIYRPSRLIRALQYTMDKNVVRKWSNKLLLQDFLKKSTQELLSLLE